MIAPAVFWIENVIAQAKPVVLGLPPERERVNRRCRAGREQMNRVGVALGFKKLPDSLDLHESSRQRLHVFHVVKQLQRFGVALAQQLFEIALETEMPPEEHERIDVTPDLAKTRNIAELAVQIRRRRNGNIRAHFRTSR